MHNVQTIINRSNVNSSECFIQSVIKTDINELFLKQEAIQQNVMKNINQKVESLLNEYFAATTEEYEKQAVIEAAQELGYLGLAVELMHLTK